MPHLPALGKILQSLLDPGSVVPARLRDRLDEPQAQAVERALRALSDVAMQRYYAGALWGTEDRLHDAHQVLIGDIAHHAHAIRSNLFLTPHEVVRRLLLMVGYSRTVLNADAQLEEQIGPDVGRFFSELDRLELGQGQPGVERSGGTELTRSIRDDTQEAGER